MSFSDLLKVRSVRYSATLFHLAWEIIIMDLGRLTLSKHTFAQTVNIKMTDTISKENLVDLEFF